MSELTLGEMMENAALTLPEGWTIRVHIERHAGWVSLENPDGYEVEYPSNRETLAESFDDALNHAIREGGSLSAFLRRHNRPEAAR